MSTGDNVKNDRPDQYSVAEESNATYSPNYSFSYKGNFKEFLLPENPMYTLQEGDYNNTISFKLDGSFKFSRDPEKVIETLAKSDHYLCKGLAALVYAVYKAGIEGKPIPAEGELNKHQG